MHFAAQKIVFIHVPKTAGNYVTTHLLPYSDDKKVLVKHQDGKDRFGLQGPLTETKHQRLQKYVRLLGAEAANYQFFATYRPPVERMISYYFSPHRWMVEDANGGFRHSRVEDQPLNLDDFSAFVDKTPSLWDQLDLENADPLPSTTKAGRHKSGARIALLRYDLLASELGRLSDALGLAGFVWPDERVNVSQVCKADLLQGDMLNRVESIVMASRHGRDAELGPKTSADTSILAKG